jgi:hypothetical protein
MAKDNKGAFKGNALSSLMGGGPPPGPPSAGEKSRPTRPEREAEERREPSRRKREARERDAKASAGDRGTTSSPTSGQRVDPRYVGASTYERKGRGEVKKLAVYLSPDVAAALREAGFRGTEHGENMSEIVETLLRENGYGGL